MKQLSGRKDYYESRPLMFILIGVFGWLAPLIFHPGARYFKISYFCSVVLWGCAYWIIQMRKNYRRRKIPIK